MLQPVLVLYIVGAWVANAYGKVHYGMVLYVFAGIRAVGDAVCVVSGAVSLYLMSPCRSWTCAPAGGKPLCTWRRLRATSSRSMCCCGLVQVLPLLGEGWGVCSEADVQPARFPPSGLFLVGL